MVRNKWKLLVLMSLLTTMSVGRKWRRRYSHITLTSTGTPHIYRIEVLFRKREKNYFSAERFCATMTPPFGVKPRNTESPYTIEYTRQPGRILVRVLGNDSVKWQGFAFQIRHNNQPVGSFFCPELDNNWTHRFSCNMLNGLHHRGSDTIYRFAPNYLRRVLVQWTPPDSLKDANENYNLTLHATMIREFPTFWLRTIDLLKGKGVVNMDMSLYDHIQNDPMPTERDPYLRDTWPKYFLIPLLHLFRKVMIVYKLWEPGLARYKY